MPPQQFNRLLDIIDKSDGFRAHVQPLKHDPEKWQPVFGQDHAELRVLHVAACGAVRNGRNAVPDENLG